MLVTRWFANDSIPSSLDELRVRSYLESSWYGAGILWEPSISITSLAVHRMVDRVLT